LPPPSSPEADVRGVLQDVGCGADDERVRDADAGRVLAPVGESFHCRTGSIIRTMSQGRCLPRDTENHNLIRWMPDVSRSAMDALGAAFGE
jgi:hypothetical protein